MFFFTQTTLSLKFVAYLSFFKYHSYILKNTCNKKHNDCDDKNCQIGKAKVDCESKDGKDPICAPEHQVRKAWDII